MHHPDLNKEKEQPRDLRYMKIMISAGKEIVREIEVGYLQSVNASKRTELVLRRVQAMLLELPELGCAPVSPAPLEERAPRAGDVRIFHPAKLNSYEYGEPCFQQWRVSDHGVGQWVPVDEVYEQGRRP